MGGRFTTLLICVASPAALIMAFVMLFFFFLAPLAGTSSAVAAACQSGTGQELPPGGGGGTVQPVDDIRISSGYGKRWGENHNGVDLPGGGEGSPIYAFADGVVAKSGPADGFGQWIVIDHILPDEKGKPQKVSTVYGHMYADDLAVSEGDRVKAGKGIARIGNNGHSTGSHLHFEYWPGGRFDGGSPTDPTRYVQAARPPGQPGQQGPRSARQMALNSAETDRGGRDGGNGDDPLGGFPLPKPDGPGKQGGRAGAIPRDYLAAYKAAGQRYDIPWQLLAGIGWAETRHGTSNAAGVHAGQNEAGAMGPMQFLQGTWDGNGVDGNGDGVRNVYDIGDAAFGAANYLVKSGVKNGPQGVWNALWAYNPAHWYANDVLNYAWQYADGNIMVTPGSVPAQCQPGGGTLRNGGDTSRGTKGADPKDVRLDWPEESATVQDPTSGGRITPRMKRLLDDLDHAPSKPSSIGCHRPEDRFPDHPGGYACDLMFTPANTEENIDAGWAMSNWLVANQKEYAVDYIIWRDKVWSAEEPRHWRTYTTDPCPDPAEVTACHYDHVHVSVYRK